MEVVPQKILIQGDFEEIRLIEDFVHAHGFDIERFFPSWSSWEHWTVQPPPDELPWTQEELDKLIEILKKHPVVKGVDFPQGEGSLS